jgi:hypothetical protein
MATADLMREIEDTLAKVREVLAVPKVPVVCLVGSPRFKAMFHEVAEACEKGGVLPLMMGFFQHADARPVSPEERETLKRVDRARIDLADEVWVLDGMHRWCAGCATKGRKPWKKDASYDSGGKDGLGGTGVFRCYDCMSILQPRPYVGDDTRYEVGYATSRGKTVRWLSAWGYQAPLKELWAVEDQLAQRG